MQKVEKWRLAELALVLKQIAELLKRGNNTEWANVFFHYHLESQAIIVSERFDLDLVIKLTNNVKNCFSGLNSLTKIVLWSDSTEEKKTLNLNMHQTRIRLIKILAEIEERTVEYVS